MNTQRTAAGKKRKAESNESEKNLYSSFVHAANAVSQLYTAAVQQTKRAEEQGARQALERVAQFVVKEYGNAPAVPTAVIMEVLRQELQAAQGITAAVQLPFPVPMLPAVSPGFVGSDSSEAQHSDDEHVMSAEPPPGPVASFRRSASSHHISPPKARSGGGVAQLPALFQQQQMQQQHHQMHQMQVAHHHMVQQQQQQQHHAAAAAAAGFMPGFPAQPPFL